MLFKYRTLDNYKFVVDIIVNARLFAATYSDLNDPMEGYYRYRDGGISKDLLEKINGARSRLRLCSLSRDSDNALMWAHYASGHRGFVVGADVDDKAYKLRSVKYDGPSYLRHAADHGDEETAINVLCHKHEVWGYEEEERVFVSGANFINITLREFILGSRMSTQDESLFKKLVAAHCPHVPVRRSEIKSM
jgi:hypothetical protein